MLRSWGYYGQNLRKLIGVRLLHEEGKAVVDRRVGRNFVEEGLGVEAPHQAVAWHIVVPPGDDKTGGRACTRAGAGWFGML